LLLQPFGIFFKNPPLDTLFLKPVAGFFLSQYMLDQKLLVSHTRQKSPDDLLDLDRSNCSVQLMRRTIKLRHLTCRVTDHFIHNFRGERGVELAEDFERPFLPVALMAFKKAKILRDVLRVKWLLGVFDLRLVNHNRWGLSFVVLGWLVLVAEKYRRMLFTFIIPHLD